MEVKVDVPTRKKRAFLPDNFVIDAWADLEPFFKELKERPLNSKATLEQWLLDKSELDCILEEDMAWRYIKMNIDTTDQNLADRFNYFVAHIQPNIAPFANDFNKKIVDCNYVNELTGEAFRIYIRGVKMGIEIFRESNIQLQSELSQEAQEYGTITAKMMVELGGEEMTMQKAATYFKRTSREQRQLAFVAMNERRQQDVDALDILFDRLLKKRHQVALNADYKNYRDYKFDSMGRFDYKPKDCFDFHASIRSEIVPIVKNFNQARKSQLGYDVLRPWDMDVDPMSLPPLKPFDGGHELLEKSIECLSKVKPFFGECLSIMREMGHLDLESKTGKAPGGFNYPLYEIGVPFIYMNAVGAMRDIITMVHEAGHAIHSFLSRDLPIADFKSTPSEVAELASMSMELITMDYWDVFLSDPDELKRAKQEQLAKILGILPWIARVDEFQHWIYVNPTHSAAERRAKWVEVNNKYSTGDVDWSGHESAYESAWQKQLHIYEVPFYYIEYGMAQLGAIAVWRNYKQNPEKALEQYEGALKLGYTATIGDIYKTAGVKFDFSTEYIKELASFVQEELKRL